MEVFDFYEDFVLWHGISSLLDVGISSITQAVA
jgi:hypothetical protein